MLVINLNLFLQAVTGLLRREDGVSIARKVPFGVLPLGKTNTVAKQLFSHSADDHFKHLAEATMAVILEVSKPLDVIKFQILPVSHFFSIKFLLKSCSRSTNLCCQISVRRK